MTSHRIGTRAEWLAASAELLEREKELTRMGDELARQRPEVLWVPAQKQYTLQTAGGARTLAEVFDGRSQLVVYHFMFGPRYVAGCPACSSTADSFNGVLAHLQARDVTVICVSRAPLDKLLAYRQRMGWRFTWASSHDSDFNFDFGVSAGEGTTHDPAAPRPEANELALRKLLTRPAGQPREPAARHGAKRERDGDRPRGLFLRGTRRQHVRVPERHCLPLLLQLRPRHGVPDGLLRDP